MVRTIVALLITLSILPLATSVFKFVGNYDFNYNLVNNELAISDLRRVMLIAYDIEVYEYQINFIYHNDNYSLSYVNDKLLLQPGSQIYLYDILQARFFIENNSIYVEYVDKYDKRYKRNIGKEKGIYINDFLDIDDGDTNDNNDDV